MPPRSPSCSPPTIARRIVAVGRFRPDRHARRRLRRALRRRLARSAPTGSPSWRARRSRSRSPATAPTRRSPAIAATACSRPRSACAACCPAPFARAAGVLGDHLSQARLGAADASAPRRRCRRWGRGAARPMPMRVGVTPARDPPPDPDRAARTAMSPRSATSARCDDAPASDALSRAQYADLKIWLPGDILTKVDRTSMAVEPRGARAVARPPPGRIRRAAAGARCGCAAAAANG